jgi:hypothetical protein
VVTTKSREIMDPDRHSRVLTGDKGLVFLGELQGIALLEFELFYTCLFHPNLYILVAFLGFQIQVDGGGGARPGGGARRPGGWCDMVAGGLPTGGSVDGGSHRRVGALRLLDVAVMADIEASRGGGSAMRQRGGSGASSAVGGRRATGHTKVGTGHAVDDGDEGADRTVDDGAKEKRSSVR